MPATVVGQILNCNGRARVAPIRFFPLSGPIVDGNALVTETVPEVRTLFDQGDFLVMLEQGDYRVEIGDAESGKSQVLIAVPNDNGTYNLKDLITTELRYAFPAPPSVNIPTATDTTPGIVMTDRAEGNPIVATMTTLNERLSRVALFPSPLPVWEFNHTLGRDPIMVTVDEFGNRFYGDESFPSHSTARVNFGANYAGKILYS